MNTDIPGNTVTLVDFEVAWDLLPGSMAQRLRHVARLVRDAEPELTIGESHLIAADMVEFGVGRWFPYRRMIGGDIEQLRRYIDSISVGIARRMLLLTDINDRRNQ